MSDQQPKLDLTKITFPTDRLSIKDLRGRFPKEFDDERVEFFNSAPGDSLEATLQLERTIAQWAFDVALGKTPADWVYDYDFDPRDEVARALIEFGLATGLHHADEQVRAIQSEAAAQAKGRGMASRP